MKPELLKTDRLRLVPVTIKTCNAELASLNRLSRLLQATIPGSWPPPLVTEDTVHEFIELLSDTEKPGLCSWYWVMDNSHQKKDDILIGSGGLYFCDDGSCEIGYSVLDGYQRQGYATEAVCRIIEYLFSRTDLEHIYATTYPGLYPSVRVLEKCGFLPDGDGKEEGSIRYVIHKFF
ncbi:MAG: GNAT family N-acetyltransferase [Methanomicrobiales archaeon]|nr:GNAT family N-acetyltransferase [Methanomicrobiales archaeon]